MEAQTKAAKGEERPTGSPLHIHFPDWVEIGFGDQLPLRRKPAHTIKPHILRGLEMMVIEDRSEVAQFMNLLATANTLYLTINSLAEGGSTASFDVAGASPAIELVHKACQG